LGSQGLSFCPGKSRQSKAARNGDDRNNNKSSIKVKGSASTGEAIIFPKHFVLRKSINIIRTIIDSWLLLPLLKHLLHRQDKRGLLSGCHWSVSTVACAQFQTALFTGMSRKTAP
jgi:hypothetical protein